MPLGWKPCQRTYRTAPPPRRCTRSATSTPGLDPGAIVPPRGLRPGLTRCPSRTAPAPPNNSSSLTRARPGCATPTSSAGASAAVSAPSATAGQSWTPIGGQNWTPIDTGAAVRRQTPEVGAVCGVREESWNEVGRGVELTPEIGMLRRQSWRPHQRKQHIGSRHARDRMLRRGLGPRHGQKAHSGTYETHQRPPAVTGGGGERGTTTVRRIADGSRTAPYYR